MKMLRREAAAVLLLLVGATAVAARPFRLRHLLGFAGPRVAAPKKVSVLGLGLLGSAIAERLLDLGWEVTLWNRTPAKAAALSRRPNARLAGSAADAANGADLILTCVTDGSALEAILFGSEGVAAAWGTRPAALDGRLVVDMSTIAPSEARTASLGPKSATARARVVRCDVSATTWWRVCSICRNASFVRPRAASFTSRISGADAPEDAPAEVREKDVERLGRWPA